MDMKNDKLISNCFGKLDLIFKKKQEIADIFVLYIYKHHIILYIIILVKFFEFIDNSNN